jgi:hypothetical protein
MIKRPPKGKARLNIVIDEGMKDFVKKYADKHKTTVTYIIFRTFQQLQEGTLRFESLDKGISKWATDYAARNHTTVEELVKQYFISLKKEEDGIGIKQI